MYYQQQAKSQPSCIDPKSSDQIRENTHSEILSFKKKIASWSINIFFGNIM